ncbi:chemotaxis protein CheA [Aquicoccus sp. SCR17]|nr:chemotaxis protein CheA [Carideicomes alvinocaridis]
MSSVSSDDFRDSFFQECEELLEAMQDGFALMVSGAHEAETVHAVFRAVHSIKGGAGAFGFDALVAFAHHFETALDKLRSGDLEAGEETLMLFQRCGDHLADLVSAARDEAGGPLPGGEELREELDSLIGEQPQEEEGLPAFEPVVLDLDAMGEAQEGPGSISILFEPEADLFRSNNEPALLFRSLERLGRLEARADLSRVPLLEDLDPEQCHIQWQLGLETEESEGEIRAVFEFVEDACRLEISSLGAAGLEDGDLPSLEDLISVSPEASLLAETAPPPPAQTAEKTESATEKTSGGPPRGAATATIRVDLDRVDKLINLVGELVIKEAMLSQSIAQLELPSENEVSGGLESLKQLAGEIQEGVMAIRAQPVKPMFQRMARIVREAATATGKRVRLVTQGEHTEVDKTVIERLIDPLTHMIRNAVDHGLESPEARREAGKPEEGTVILSAAHRSGRVMIDISDDGGGINREKVRKIAESKGLVSPEADLSAVEIDNLLFLPGFSSKEQVSELSGRGVGLDVARSEVQTLGGRVSIASTPGEGTTFSISLPLTLAVMEGMVIEVAGQTMVVPITAIQESLQTRTAEIHSIGATGRVVANRERLVPIVDLGETFGLRRTPQNLDGHVLLMVETDSTTHCALIVDAIQDQRQVVIKSLETNYGHVHGVAAATILGDGRIALIIDPDSIIRDTVGAAGADLQLQLAR